MLKLAFMPKYRNTLQVFHKGESFTLIVDYGLLPSEISLVIDAPQSFQFVRGNAKHKQVPPSTHLSERVRARFGVTGGRN